MLFIYELLDQFETNKLFHCTTTSQGEIYLRVLLEPEKNSIL